MKIWAKTKEFWEGKFLVVRRDGTVPAWPHFVMGYRDPAVPAGLRGYADEAERLGFDPEYVASVREAAEDAERYRSRQGPGDPDAPPHRRDNPKIIDLMAGRQRAVAVIITRDQDNKPKEAKASPRTDGEPT